MFSEVRTDKFVFSLDSYNKDSDFYEDIIISAQTSNIFVFIGHVCELRRYILTAFQEGKFVVLIVKLFVGLISKYGRTTTCSRTVIVSPPVLKP